MGKPHEDRDLIQAWEQGKPAEVTRVRTSSSVLSIRIPHELFEELSNRADGAGKSVSQFARELIEQGLSSDAPSTPIEVASMFSRWAHEMTGSAGAKKTRRT